MFLTMGGRTLADPLVMPPKWQHIAPEACLSEMLEEFQNSQMVFTI